MHCIILGLKVPARSKDSGSRAKRRTPERKKIAPSPSQNQLNQQTIKDWLKVDRSNQLRLGEMGSSNGR